ncbi:MAG: phosphoglucomutase/phosphomannomutase family protein, partial [Clostridia bacterium]|nr:phosphoglucomutase/phosphomannomutase family protein [Clostridia bacterium]
MVHLSFGTDGWREVMAERFTFPNVRVVSQAIALYLRNEANWQAGVVVGHDCRFQSDKFAEAVAEVLAGNSIRVYLVEKPTPTPVLAVCVRKLKTAGAVVITASHNPPEYNGVKFIPDYAGPALPHITEGIEGNISWVLDSGDIKWMSLGDAASWGLVKKVDPKEDYIAHVKELVDEKAISRAGLSVIA